MQERGGNKAGKGVFRIIVRVELRDAVYNETLCLALIRLSGSLRLVCDPSLLNKLQWGVVF